MSDEKQRPRTVLDTTLLLAIISSLGYAYAVAYFVGYCNWFRISGACPVTPLNPG